MIASSAIIVSQAGLVVVFCKGSDLNPSNWKVEDIKFITSVDSFTYQ